MVGNLSNAWLIFMGNTSLQRSNVFVETVIYVMYYLENGNNKGVIKWEAVYKCTNRDYLPEAEPWVNYHFTCEAKPIKGKMYCPRA